LATSYPGVPEEEEPFVLACCFIGIARRRSYDTRREK
jgi:hypothetical protein